jgi:hypothetical protein
MRSDRRRVLDGAGAVVAGGLFASDWPPAAFLVRRALEAKILAGEPLSAPQIRKTRGPLKGGSPERAIQQPAPRMAA